MVAWVKMVGNPGQAAASLGRWAQLARCRSDTPILDRFTFTTPFYILNIDYRTLDSGQWTLDSHSRDEHCQKGLGQEHGLPRLNQARRRQNPDILLLGPSRVFSCVRFFVLRRRLSSSP